MRNTFIKALAAYADNPDFCVLAGDLGWGVLEPLAEKLGERFINAGIAEQNMLSAAAGLAETGMRPFVYSISPFIYARAFEQIRNDICLQDLPVCMIASGAGYGYGNSGPTHHAIEDYGIISTLQNIKVYVPSFASDMKDIAAMMAGTSHPAYMRLGRDESNPDDDYERPAFSAYRRLKRGSSGVVLTIGNMAGSVMSFCPDDFAVWACGTLPVLRKDIPDELFRDIRKTGSLIVIEDHVAAGGLCEQFCACMLEEGVRPEHFARFYAQGYGDGLYGSQNYYREHNGLSVSSILSRLSEFRRR